MSVAVALVIAAAVAAGIYLALSRDLFRCVVGLAILGSAANLAVFAAGRIGPLAPPLVDPGALALPADAANPLPQALVLTAIVISFALLCFSLVLAAAVARRTGQEDTDRLRAAEPEPDQPLKPPVID
ncbi:MAG: NADH-quinone oxidoreductase subunit K [Gammaproteobacteria bacterium]|nr:NADH-quinone oxidoreductase subunit K [Gammaproteobacteria bacterium]